MGQGAPPISQAKTFYPRKKKDDVKNRGVFFEGNNFSNKKREDMGR